MGGKGKSVFAKGEKVGIVGSSKGLKATDHGKGGGRQEAYMIGWGGGQQAVPMAKTKGGGGSTRKPEMQWDCTPGGWDLVIEQGSRTLVKSKGVKPSPAKGGSKTPNFGKPSPMVERVREGTEQSPPTTPKRPAVQENKGKGQQSGTKGKMGRKNEGKHEGASGRQSIFPRGGEPF